MIRFDLIWAFDLWQQLEWALQLEFFVGDSVDCRKWLELNFFFLWEFSFTDTGSSQDNREGGNHLLFHSTISTCSQTFRYLFATLNVRWLSHIFNCNACIYQTGTWWDLPPYWITIWLIDDVMLIFACLLIDLILGFAAAIWLSSINYHPCITSKPTNQVC